MPAWFATLFAWSTVKSALLAAAIATGVRVGFNLLSDVRGIDPRERERWQPQTPRSAAEIPRRVVVGRARVGAINIWYRVDRARAELHSLWILGDASKDHHLGIVDVDVDSRRRNLKIKAGAPNRLEVLEDNLDVVFDGTGEQTSNARLHAAGFAPDGPGAPNTIEGVAWLFVTQRNPADGFWKNRGLPEVFATVQHIHADGDGAVVENPATLAGWWLARHGVQTDAASLAAAAAHCAETILGGDDKEVPRFRCGGMIESTDPFWRVVRAFEEAMDGRIVIGGDGLARLYAGVAAAPSFHIEDTVGPPTVQHEGRRREQRNILRARIRAHSDPRRRGAEVLVESRLETSITETGEWTHDAGFLRLVAHEGQARRLLASQLRRSQRPIVVTATLPETLATVRMRAWQRGAVHLDALGAEGTFRLLADPKWNRKAGTVEVELVEDPLGLYSDSEDPTIAPRGTTPEEAGPLPRPENLRADADALVQNDGTVVVQTSVEWDPPPALARRAHLQVRRWPSTVWLPVGLFPAAGPALLPDTPPGRTFDLRALFEDARGSLSAWSEVVSFTPGGDLQPPAAPTGLEAEPLTETTAKISWARPADDDYARTELFTAGSTDAAPAGSAAGNAGSGGEQAILTIEKGTEVFVWARSLDHSGNKSAWTDPVLARPAPGIGTTPGMTVDVEFLWLLSNVRPLPPPDLAIAEITRLTDWIADFNAVGFRRVGEAIWQADRTILVVTAADGSQESTRTPWRISIAAPHRSPIEGESGAGIQSAFSNEQDQPAKPIFRPGPDQGWGLDGALTKFRDSKSGVDWYGNDRCDGIVAARWVTRRTATRSRELIEGEKYTPWQHDATTWSEPESYTPRPEPKPEPSDLPEVVVGKTKTFQVGPNPFGIGAPDAVAMVEAGNKGTALVWTGWTGDQIELSITGKSVGELTVKIVISAPFSGGVDQERRFRVRIVETVTTSATVVLDGIPETLALRPGETRDEDFSVQPEEAVTSAAAAGAASLAVSLPDNDGGIRKLRIVGRANTTRRDAEAVVTVTAAHALSDGSTVRNTAAQTVTLEPDPWISVQGSSEREFEPDAGVHHLPIYHGPAKADRASRFEADITSGNAVSSAAASIDQVGSRGRKLHDSLRLVLNDNSTGKKPLVGAVRVRHIQTYQGSNIRRTAHADLSITVKPGKGDPLPPGIYLQEAESVAVGETKTVAYRIVVEGGAENLPARNLVVSILSGGHSLITLRTDPAPKTGDTRSFRVTGKKASTTATVRVTLTDNEGRQASADCLVTVTGPPGPSCSGLPERVTLEPGSSRRLAFQVANATSVTARASNANVRVSEIFEDGAARALYLYWVKAGSATVTVTVTGGGQSATCLIAVTLNPRPGPSCSGLPERVFLEADASRRLAFRVANATSVTAAASNANVRTVLYGSGGNRALYLHWVKAGSATVTVRVAGGGQSATCLIAVTLQPRPIDGLPSSATLRVGDSRTYSVSVSLPNVSVRTSKSGIVSALLGRATGNTRTLTVRALAVGVVTVTVTASDLRGDDSSSETMTVTVLAAVANAEITGLDSRMTMDVGETDTDAFTVRNTSGVSVSSSDTSIATARATGSGSSRTLRVTGVAGGSTAVTVTAAGRDGGEPAEEDVAVTVNALDVPNARISGLKTQFDLDVDETGSDDFEAYDTSGVSVSSSDTGIATARVTGSGSSRTLRVTGEAAGDTTVRVTAAGKNGGEPAEEDVAVTVNAPAALPAQISGLVSRLPAMEVGESEADSFTVRNASRVTAHGGDWEIATYSVSGSGSSRTLRATGASQGSTTVTVTAYGRNGGDDDDEDVGVTVNAPPNPPPVLTDLAAAYSLKTYPNSGYTITDYYSVSPSTASVSVTSSNTSLVKVRQDDTSGTNRHFTLWAAGQKTGRATVTVTARANGKTTTRERLVTVTKPGGPDPDPPDDL